MLRQCLGSASAVEQPPTAKPRHKARPSQNWPKITTYDHVHQIFITSCTWFRRGVLCDRGLTTPHVIVFFCGNKTKLAGELTSLRYQYPVSIEVAIISHQEKYGVVVKGGESLNNFLPHFTMDALTHLRCKWSWSKLVKVFVMGIRRWPVDSSAKDQ